MPSTIVDHPVHGTSDHSIGIRARPTACFITDANGPVSPKNVYRSTVEDGSLLAIADIELFPNNRFDLRWKNIGEDQTLGVVTLYGDPAKPQGERIFSAVLRQQGDVATTRSAPRAPGSDRGLTAPRLRSSAGGKLGTIQLEVYRRAIDVKIEEGVDFLNPYPKDVLVVTFLFNMWPADGRHSGTPGKRAVVAKGKRHAVSAPAAKNHGVPSAAGDVESSASEHGVSPSSASMGAVDADDVLDLTEEDAWSASSRRVAEDAADEPAAKRRRVSEASTSGRAAPEAETAGEFEARVRAMSLSQLRELCAEQEAAVERERQALIKRVLEFNRDQKPLM